MYVDNPFTAGPDGFSPDDNSQLYCLREGLVNSAHPDYFSPMHPTIRKFDDRIEFQNPGSFIVGINVVKTKNASFPRNPTIINLFRYVKLSESAGYGIDKILRWEKLTKQAVDFETSILYSTITYHLPKSNTKSSTKSSTKNEKTIISAIRSNPKLSITDMCPITGLSRSGVQKIIIRLRQQGVLRRVGPAKGGYWEIIE